MNYLFLLRLVVVRIKQGYLIRSIERFTLWSIFDSSYGGRLDYPVTFIIQQSYYPETPHKILLSGDGRAWLFMEVKGVTIAHCIFAYTEKTIPRSPKPQPQRI